MLKQRLVGNHGCNINVKAERPVHTKPQIVDVYYDSDGTRMYETSDNRTFIADVVDRIWDTAKGPVMRKGYKSRKVEPLKILLY
jgi:hypothetical protein